MKKTIALSLILAASMSLAVSTTAGASPQATEGDEQLNDATVSAMDSITPADEAMVQSMPQAAAPSTLSFASGITTT